jgi:hypothetical protein
LSAVKFLGDLQAVAEISLSQFKGFNNSCALQLIQASNQIGA